MIDKEFLKAFTEAPSVGTACGPVNRLLSERLGAAYTRTEQFDGFCLFQKADYTPDDLRVVLITHVDEVGGVVYGPRSSGGYTTRYWGNHPEVFSESSLQGFDYLATDASEAFEVTGQIVTGDPAMQRVMPGYSHRAFEKVEFEQEHRLILHGERIRPYRTAWTFRQETEFEGDWITGKALDPRVTAYAALDTLQTLNDGRVGALFVQAEECAMDVARKAVTFLQRNAPHLALIVNADVPGVDNIDDGDPETPAIRIFEGRNFIDPTSGIRVYDSLRAANVVVNLTVSRSGSQTLLFTPLAPTLSVALPSLGIHVANYRMSLLGTQRCCDLLRAICELHLSA